MKSKLTQVANLTVDNRASGGGMNEVDMRRCSHCRRYIKMNPFRQRPRNWCMKCDDYVCDNPACVIECTPWNRIVDDFLEGKITQIPANK